MIELVSKEASCISHSAGPGPTCSVEHSHDCVHCRLPSDVEAPYANVTLIRQSGVCSTLGGRTGECILAPLHPQ